MTLYFYEILQSIMYERDLTIPEVARLSSLPDSTIRSIISRKNKTVALEVAFKLSKGLNVSLEELNGETPLTQVQLSQLKRKALKVVGDLNDEQLIAVLAFIDTLNTVEKNYSPAKE